MLDELGRAPLDEKLPVPSRRRRRFEAVRQCEAAVALARAKRPAPEDPEPAGLLRVRGRVHLIRPVRSPDQRELAAWQSVDLETRACGRFAVVGDAVVAVVDDDCFEVWTGPPGEEVGARAAGGSVEDRSQIDIVGRARKIPADDLASLAASSYRGTPTVLLFEGSPGDPVRMFVRGTAVDR